MTASYGLRFESQNAISDHADWAPRLGLAWGLGHGANTKTVLRAGFGIFYDRLDDDQMIQAARSGKQNIIEGSMASATSKETEIKLTNVARASLEELLADYRDFLRVRGLKEWDKNHPHARRLGELIRTRGIA